MAIEIATVSNTPPASPRHGGRPEVSRHERVRISSLALIMLLTIALGVTTLISLATGAVSISPRTISAAMLGQHPQMYSLLETHLFICDTMSRWWSVCRHHNLDHGLARAIAELLLGRQDEASVEWARVWIQRHLHWTTTDLFRFLAGLVPAFGRVSSAINDQANLKGKSQ